MSQFQSLSRVSVVFALLAVLAGCHARFRRIQKSEDWRVKYEAATEYYEKKDYYRAALLFEDIRPQTRGLPEGEKVEFFLGYCHYYEKTYLLAADQFKSFYETYGRSGFAEEAQFMYAYSLYTSAPPDNLDQSEGIEAMDAMQEFLNRYPTTKFYDRSVEVITKSQHKLEKKGFENAAQYLKIQQYKAAVIALQNFCQEFPDSEMVEDALAMKIISQYKLAEESLTSLQLERYQAVVDFYQQMLDQYPKSKMLREVEKLYSASLIKINQLKTKSS